MALSPPNTRGLLATGSQELYHHRPSKGLCTTTKRLCPSMRSLGVAMVTEGAWEEGGPPCLGGKGHSRQRALVCTGQGGDGCTAQLRPSAWLDSFPSCTLEEPSAHLRTPWPLSGGWLPRPWLLSALSGFGPSLAVSLRFLCSPPSSVGWGSEPGPS